MPEENLPPLRALLIFNPGSGLAAEAPQRLLAILGEMQAWNIQPEVFLLGPETDLAAAVKDALRRGMRLFVASGGDGTIDSAASLLCGTRAALGVIPGGTRNNVALSLGIPRDIPGAAALLRGGRAVKVDMGVAECLAEECGSGTLSGGKRAFLEICTVGLFSALFPAADEIQRGNLTRLGDLLSTLAASPPAAMRLRLEGGTRLELSGHVVLAGNMPYVGPNYPVAPPAPAQVGWIHAPGSQPALENPYSDGLLDLLVFSSTSKLDLLGAALQSAGGSGEDPRIQRYRVRKFEIETDPPMPVLVDGVQAGVTPLRVRIQRRALTMLVPSAEE